MKIYLYKIAVFILFILFLQTVISYLLTPEPLKIATLKKLDVKETDLLYFGDSVVDYIDPSDSIKSTIPDLLQEKIRTETIKDISHSGYTLKVYDALVYKLKNSKVKPKKIILPLNIAAFSPTWYSVPGLQFEKEIFILKHPVLGIFYKPLAILRAINTQTVTEERFRNSDIYYKDKKIGTIRDFTQDDIRSSYLVRYMASLTNNNPAVMYLSRLLSDAQSAGITVYTYITPVNVQAGSRIIGNEFKPHIKETAKTLCDIVKEHSFPCLDLTDIVQSEDFQYYKDHANEHLKEGGRIVVAEKLSTLLAH